MVDEQADVSRFSQIKHPRGAVLRQIERDIGMSRLVLASEAPTVAARDRDPAERRDRKDCARYADIRAAQFLDRIERLKPQFVEVRFRDGGIVDRLKSGDKRSLQIKGVQPPKADFELSNLACGAGA